MSQPHNRYIQRDEHGAIKLNTEGKSTTDIEYINKAKLMGLTEELGAD